MSVYSVQDVLKECKGTLKNVHYSGKTQNGRDMGDRGQNQGWNPRHSQGRFHGSQRFPPNYRGNKFSRGVNPYEGGYDMRNLVCHNCGDKGHFARSCRKKRVQVEKTTGMENNLGKVENPTNNE